MAVTHENYRAPTGFFGAARDHLAPGGRMLVFFGSSGDLGDPRRLIAEHGFRAEIVARAEPTRDGQRVEYLTYRLSLRDVCRAVAPRGTLCYPGPMPAELTQRDLRARSGQIMDAVAHGESFIVTRHGTPIGELIPLRRHRAVSREQFAAMSMNAPVIDAARFRADADEAIDGGLRDPYDR